MENDELLNHVIEIKERISSLEAKLETSVSVTELVADLDREMTKMKTSVKIFQWMFGIVAAVGVALVKAWKN